MAKSVTQYELLISCPSDVNDELNMIKETVEDFNRMFGSANNTSIITKHWSKDSYPQSGGKPQKLLNEQFVINCDSAVAVFWTRFGTPTDQYGSGTEEEIEELIKSNKQVFLYFCDREISPSSIDYDQYKNVQNFRKKYKDKGLYFTYSNLDEFKKMFLNHLSLYFVGLFNNVKQESSNPKSKLSINGVIKGKITEFPHLIKPNFLNSNFMYNIKKEIIEVYRKIQNIEIQGIQFHEDRQNESNSPSINDNSLVVNKEIFNMLQKLNISSSSFGKSEIFIEDFQKELIINFAKENKLEMNETEFFCIGALYKQNSPRGGGPFGINPSYSLIGSDNEKEKLKLIEKLCLDIDKYNQWNAYFEKLDRMDYLNLCLSNSGTHFDEDIDVKLFIKDGYLCKENELPIPGNDILETCEEISDILFKAQKSVSVKEYEEYPTRDLDFDNKLIYGLNGPTYTQKVESNKKRFFKTLENTFCYEFFKENGYDVIGYKQSYIKQNTNVYFPSILIFKLNPGVIQFEITSKYSPQIVKGEIKIKG